MSFKHRNFSLRDLNTLLHYDPTSGQFTWKAKAGNKIKIGDIAGSVQKNGYRVIGLGNKLYREHRLAWLYVYGFMPDAQIDHINMDRADNRIANLRIASNGENMQNARGAKRNNKTGVRGVGLWKGKFRARITVGGEKIWLGQFDSAQEAGAAYAEAQKRMHPFAPQSKSQRSLCQL